MNAPIIEYVDSDELRVSDAEREAAIGALGEHMSAGRLTVDEYGDRTAQVTTALTRADVRAQFHDLPAPGPRFDTAEPTPVATPETPDRRPRLSARVPSVVLIALVVLVGLAVLSAVTKASFVFLFIPLAIVLAKSTRGHRRHW